MPTETLPSPMARALRSANLPLAASLAASHPHSDIITSPVTATGLTPLHLATILRDARLVDILIAAGAPPDAHAFLLAAQEREPRILASLLAGASRDVVRIADEAVHAAAWAGCKECVRILVEGGVGLEWRAGDGATAVCCAVMAGDEEMVACLINGGAHVLGVRACGVSVEDWAWRQGGRVRDLVVAEAEKERRRRLVEEEGS